MGFAAPILGLVGAGVSAFGAMSQGNAASANASYQAQVAKNNAAIAAQNESWTSAAGASKEAAEGMKTRSAVGQIKATQGASNIDVNTGSAAKVSAGAAEMGELDAMTIRSNTSRQAYGYAVQQASDNAESTLLTSEASQDKEGGDLSALGTFLNGASSVGSKWANYQLGNPGTS
jgi:hypothetical protein